MDCPLQKFARQLVADNVGKVTETFVGTEEESMKQCSNVAAVLGDRTDDRQTTRVAVWCRSFS